MRIPGGKKANLAMLAERLHPRFSTAAMSGTWPDSTYLAQGSNDVHCEECYLQPRKHAIIGIFKPFT